MIITGAMPAWHFSGVSHHRRRSRQIDHDFAGAVEEKPTLPFLRRFTAHRLVAECDMPTASQRSAAWQPGQ